MRALENLIDNAEKYSPKGTPVEISAQGKNHGVEIVVRDHGKGIPQGIKAFAAEVAAGEATSAPPAESGERKAGLGLALVRVIAEAHHGKVSAANMPDGGAAVKLWLPEQGPEKAA
jgi:two-component system sensor histidine kinase KdpD